MDHASLGDKALKASNYEEAIQHFSRAIEKSPKSPIYYISRSTARSRANKHEEALKDAEIAVTLATERARREQIAQAQLRRAIELFHLEQYGNADFVMKIAKSLTPNEKTIPIWESKLAMKLKTLEDGDAKAQVTVMAEPPVHTADSVEPVVEATADSAERSSGQMSVTASAPSQTPVSRIRHEWYQNSESVYVTLMAKGVPKDQAAINIQERSLSISLPLVSGSTFEFSLDPLFATVDTTASTYQVFSTKVEVVLRKAQAGQKWSSLEGIEPVALPTAPSYPTSSRSGPKDWDKIASTFTKPAKKDTDAEEDKSKVDYVDEDEGADEVNSFFQKIYKNASEDTKRAMMKSYQESGGTALSTNWDEVKKGPVPISPPEGMEAKKWES